MSGPQFFILTVRCPDRKGIVAAVSAFLLLEEASITESSQCDEDDVFFMRTVFSREAGEEGAIDGLRRRFGAVAERFAMDWALHDAREKPRLLIAVSKFGHCLNDLLHRWRTGQLPVEIAGVVSNHDDMRGLVEWHGLPYHYLPIAKGEKGAQEARFLALADALAVDLVVLARYMQILSPAMCAALSGRCINIHHSFLPSFKGAKPYHQAHARGVKIIGATAHYVTTDLDEGPIIEQGTHRIDHGYSAERLVELGQDVECTVLARAVRWHVEHRIMLNGQKTIVFA
jgi:formyltetrahydrofolate deformylase